MDMVLGGALQNIVVERDEDAKRMIEFLRKNRFGRATFLPIGSVRGRTLNAQERAASDDAGLRRAWRPSWFGLIRSIRVWWTIFSGERWSRKIWTRVLRFSVRVGISFGWLRLMAT